ncbi:MAG: hypothetical protein HY516_04925 [Candidatus Aenigmarchaeota archaeon]|nr:hypothetical protein [Candidatus Aenigmarchaeota archaeon]
MKLVGTLHNDLEGPRRLRRLLDYLSPEAITIEAAAGFPLDEMVRKISENNRRKSRAVNSINGPQNMKQLYTELCELGGYEILVSVEYAGIRGVQIHGADHPQTSVLLDYDTDEIFLEIVKKEFGGMRPEVARIPYSTLRRRYTEHFNKGYYDPHVITAMDQRMSPDAKAALKKATEHEGLEPEVREQFMADEIRRKNPQLHVGGLSHVFEGYPLGVTPLFMRLGGIVSERMRLSEADSITP